MEFAKNLLPRVHMREGVKQLVLSVCQFVNLFVSPVKSFYISI